MYLPKWTHFSDHIKAFIGTLLSNTPNLHFSSLHLTTQLFPSVLSIRPSPDPLHSVSDTSFETLFHLSYKYFSFCILWPAGPQPSLHGNPSCLAHVFHSAHDKWAFHNLFLSLIFSIHRIKERDTKMKKFISWVTTRWWLFILFLFYPEYITYHLTLPFGTTSQMRKDQCLNQLEHSLIIPITGISVNFLREWMLTRTESFPFSEIQLGNVHAGTPSCL